MKMIKNYLQDTRMCQICLAFCIFKFLLIQPNGPHPLGVRASSCSLRSLRFAIYLSNHSTSSSWNPGKDPSCPSFWQVSFVFLMGKFLNRFIQFWPILDGNCFKVTDNFKILAKALDISSFRANTLIRREHNNKAAFYVCIQKHTWRNSGLL